MVTSLRNEKNNHKCNLLYNDIQSLGLYNIIKYNDHT